MRADSGWWGWLRALLRWFGLGREPGGTGPHSSKESPAAPCTELHDEPGGRAERRGDFEKADDESATAPEAVPGSLRYALRDDFLTPAEASFYRVLCAAVRERHLVFPKVRLADLVYAPHQDRQYAAWQRINRKHLDFVLCDPRTLRPILAVELDDQSHRRADRVHRDAFVDQVFAAVGLPLVRVSARHGYSTQALAVVLAEALAQPRPTVPSAPPSQSGPANARICERCGGIMRLRTATRGERRGEQFWGCTNYPRCRNIVPMS